MVTYQIISEGIPIGNFKKKERAEKALAKYADNGYIQETEEGA